MQKDNEIVKKGAVTVDDRISDTMNGRKVSTIDNSFAIDEFKSLLLGIRELIGIKEISKNTAVVFYDFISKYHRDMTMQEIKLAFELLVVGELDSYLPQKNGVADRNHYQMFSMEYVSRVLSAYKKRRSRIKIKKHTLPMPKMDKDEIKKNFRKTIVQVFEEYRDYGTEIFFLNPKLVVKELNNCGLKIDVEEVTNERINEHFEKLINSDNKRLRRKLKEEHSRLGESLTARIKVTNDVYDSAIKEKFNELIHQNKDLKFYMNV